MEGGVPPVEVLIDTSTLNCPINYTHLFKMLCANQSVPVPVGCNRSVQQKQVVALVVFGGPTNYCLVLPGPYLKGFLTLSEKNVNV